MRYRADGYVPSCRPHPDHRIGYSHPPGKSGRTATFELLARPILAALSGEPELLPERKRAVLDTSFSKGSPIRRFVRGRYESGHVALPEGHSSGQLRSLAGCNCLVDIPAGSGPLEAGTEMDILML